MSQVLYTSLYNYTLPPLLINNNKFFIIDDDEDVMVIFYIIRLMDFFFLDEAKRKTRANWNVGFFRFLQQNKRKVKRQRKKKIINN